MKNIQPESVSSRRSDPRSIVAFLIAAACLATTTLAGARIDLRPDPPIPPGGYEPNTTVLVSVYFVDTGPSEWNVQFRAIYLDFNDTPPWDGSSETLAPHDSFNWNNPFGHGWPSLLPNPAWIYPLATPNPLLQITMLAGGEVFVGDVYVNVGTSGGTLDVMNADNPDLNWGARAEFGFGGSGDPFTRWRAYTGELTGGILDLPVVPEPTTLLLLSVGLAVAVRTRTRRNAR